MYRFFESARLAPSDDAGNARLRPRAADNAFRRATARDRSLSAAPHGTGTGACRRIDDVTVVCSRFRGLSVRGVDMHRTHMAAASVRRADRRRRHAVINFVSVRYAPLTLFAIAFFDCQLSIIPCVDTTPPINTQTAIITTYNTILPIPPPITEM